MDPSVSNKGMGMPSNTEKHPFKFQKKDLKEIFYILVLLVVFLFFELKIKYYLPDNENFVKKAEFFTVLFLFGLMHLLCSNVLSFMYNLRTVMIPFLRPPRFAITPKKLKVLGGVSIIVSLVGWSALGLSAKIQ